MNQNKVYSLQGQFLLGPAGNYNNQFDLSNNNRAFNIKSIFWDYFLLENGQLAVLPTDTQTIINALLTIGGPAPALVSESFQNILVPLSILYNGSGFTIQKPRKLNFENWFFANNVHFTVQFINGDRLLTALVGYVLVVEIEKL